MNNNDTTPRYVEPIASPPAPSEKRYTNPINVNGHITDQTLFALVQNFEAAKSDLLEYVRRTGRLSFDCNLYIEK